MLSLTLPPLAKVYLSLASRDMRHAHPQGLRRTVGAPAFGPRGMVVTLPIQGRTAVGEPDAAHWKVLP